MEKVLLSLFLKRCGDFANPALTVGCRTSGVSTVYARKHSRTQRRGLIVTSGAVLFSCPDGHVRPETLGGYRNALTAMKFFHNRKKHCSCDLI